MTGTALPDWNDAHAARLRIAPYTHRTPVMISTQLNRLTGASLFFKCENLQRTGSFKARGACNAVFSLDEETAQRGVATHSSGNHGQALSFAAARRGIPAWIVMPETAPAVKRAAVEAYGGQVITCAAGLAAREAALQNILAETGAHLVHPYADAKVIAGQASVSIELIEEVGELDEIVAPIGGGGLISGVALAASQLAPQAKIFAAEPELADDAYRSLAAGRLIEGADAPATVADGLRASLKPMTWHFVRQHVAGVRIASEQQIIEAMQLIWQRMKLIVEPSGAVPLAALLRSPELIRGKRVGIILSGGNVDLERLPWQH